MDAPAATSPPRVKLEATLFAYQCRYLFLQIWYRFIASSTIYLTILGPLLDRSGEVSVVQFLYKGLNKSVPPCVFPNILYCSTARQHEEKQVASSLDACFVAGYPLGIGERKGDPRNGGSVQYTGRTRGWYDWYEG